MRKTIRLCLLFTLVTPLGCFGQTSPTLQETLEFIKGKIEGSSASGNAVEKDDQFSFLVVNNYSSSYSGFQVNGCQVAWRQSSHHVRTIIRNRTEAKSTKEETREITVQLGKLDVTRIEANKIDVCEVLSIGCSMGEKQAADSFVHLLFPGNSGQTPVQINEITTTGSDASMGTKKSIVLAVQTSDLADRLAKAFANAGKLCGAKPDPF